VQEEKLMEELKSINFYRNKAKSVKNCCITLVEKFGGEVPKTIDKLTSLPGVGRKTANVILGNCFGVPAIITDTHLIRVSQKLGLTEKTDPDKIEMELKEIIPRDKQTLYSHVIGEHGRKVCKGRKPLCTECVVCKSCPSSEA
jgi:endonuclease-3